jgi:hypothetical protein
MIIIQRITIHASRAILVRVSPPKGGKDVIGDRYDCTLSVALFRQRESLALEMMSAFSGEESCRS